MAFPVSRRGRGRSSISAVCTSANARNICCSSGRFVNFANRLRGRSDAPSGEISIVSTTSPKVAAQASKCSMPRLCKPSGSRKRWIGVHLDHRVGDRRAGGKRDAVAGVPLVEIPGLHVEIKRALAPPGLDAGHAVHLGRGLEVLEEVGLVDEDVIDAEFVKHEAVVLLVLG